MAERNENYWKDRYQGTWDRSAQREAKLAEYLEQKTGLQIESSGLGAQSTEYIPGSAAKNGFEKGDADLHVVGTNVYTSKLRVLWKRTWDRNGRCGSVRTRSKMRSTVWHGAM